jgi:hypothetical protein
MEKLNLSDIIEIQQIKDRIRKDESLYNMFIVLLKIVNKKVNSEDLEEIINDTDTETETEKSLDLSSDSSDSD